MSKDWRSKSSERRSHGNTGDRRTKQSSSQLSKQPRNISLLRETIEIGSSDSDVIVLDSLSSSDDDLPSYSYITPTKKNVAAVHGRSHQDHLSTSTSRQRSSSPRRISETPSPRVTKPSSSSASNSRSGPPLPKRSKLNSGSAVASAESARSSGAKKSTHSSGSRVSVRRRSPSPAPRRRLPQEKSRHRSESSARGRLSSSRTSGHHSSMPRTSRRSPLATHSQRSGFSRQPLKERSGSKGSSGTGRSSSRSKDYLSSGSKDSAKRGTLSGLAQLGNHFSDSDSSDSMSRFDVPDEPGLIPSRSGVIRSPTARCNLLPFQSGDVRDSMSRPDLPSSKCGSTSSRGFTDEPGLVPSRSGVVRSPANSTSSSDLPDEPGPLPSRSGAQSSSASRRNPPDKLISAPSKSGAIRRLFTDKDNSQKTTLNKTRHHSCNLVSSPSLPLVLERDVREASGSKTATSHKRHVTVIDLSGDDSDVTAWNVHLPPSTGLRKEAGNDSHSSKAMEGDKLPLSQATESDKSHSSKAAETGGKSRPSKTSASHSSKVADASTLHPSKVAEATTSHSSKVADVSALHPGKVAETSTSHPSKVLGTGKSDSSKVAETGKARTTKRTETGKLCSGKMIETVSSTEPDKSHSSKASETGKSQTSKASETGKSQSSKTSETGKSQSSKASETSKSQSSKASETGKSQSSKTSETGKSQLSKTSETGKSQSGKTLETGKSQSSKTSETGKSQSSKASDTGSKPHSSKVTEGDKSHSGKPARSGVSNKKPSTSQRPLASRLQKSSLPSQPPAVVASGPGRGPKSQSQSHSRQNTPTGPTDPTGKVHSDIILSRNPHSPTVPSLPIGMKGGLECATSADHPRNKACQLTTPPEMPQPLSSGSVTGITSMDPTVPKGGGLEATSSPAPAITSSKSSGLKPAKSIATSESRTSPDVNAAVTDVLQQTSNKKTSVKPLKTSRKIKLKCLSPASQDVLTHQVLAGITKGKGRGKGKQAVSHAQDKESTSSTGSKAAPSIQSGSSAGCLNVPSRPHSRESVSTLSSSCFTESTDDIESLWSFQSMADPNTDSDSMSIVSGAGSLDAMVTLGTKTMKQTKSSKPKHKHVRRQTARKSTGGLSFKRPRFSYTSGHLLGYGMVPLKSCTVDVVRTRWSRKIAATGGADESSGPSIPQKVKPKKNLKEQKGLKEGGRVRTNMDLGQTSAIKLQANSGCLTTAAVPSHLVDAVIMSECSIPDGIITPKKRKQRKLTTFLDSSDSEPETDPTPAAKKPRLTPSLPPTTEHRETSSAPELNGETCARTRVYPRKRNKSEAALTSSNAPSVPQCPLSTLTASSSSSSAKHVVASPLQLRTLLADSSRQTIKEVPSESNLVASVTSKSLTPEVVRTNQRSVIECSPSGAGKGDARDQGSVSVATSLQLQGTEAMQSCGAASRSFGANKATFPDSTSSRNKLSLCLKPKQDRSNSEPPVSATPLPTPLPEKSSSVPPLHLASFSSPVSTAPLKMSPRDEEYSLRLQETIAKLAGGGAEDGVWNFGSPQRASLLSPPTLDTSQSNLTVSFRLASLSRQPSPPTPTENSRSRLPSVTTTRLGTYVSQGVQAEIGMVVNREVLDSYLTVKTNEVLYELKEMLEAADRQVARITKEKEELEKMVLEKERVIQKLTQTGFKYRHKRVDKATSTEKATKSVSTQTKKLKMPKPKRTTNRASQKSSRTKHASWKSFASAETPNCLRHYSEEELKPFFSQSFSPPLTPCSPSSREPDATDDTEVSEWLSREDSTSRCIPIRPQVRLIRAVRGGERLRRHSEPAVSTRRNGLAVAEWDSLGVSLRGEFLQLWQILNLFKELRMEPLLLRRLASVIETLDHLLSHIPPPQDQELTVLGEDLQQRTTVGLAAWVLGSKLQQLIINLENLHGDEKNGLPSYFRAELIHTRTVVIETLRFITHGMRHVTMFHDAKGFAVGANTLVVPSSPSPDLSPSPAPSSLLQCNEEDLDDLFSSSASELESSSSEEEEELGEGRSARTSHFRYKRVPPSPSSCARVSPWCPKGTVHTPTHAAKSTVSSITNSPDVSMSIATTEPGLSGCSRAIQQLEVPASTSRTSSSAALSSSSGTSQVMLNAMSGKSTTTSSKTTLSTTSTDLSGKVALSTTTSSKTTLSTTSTDLSGKVALSTTSSSKTTLSTASTDLSGKVALSTTTSSVTTLSTTSTDPTSSHAENIDRTALLERVTHTITEKINQITAKRLPVPNRLHDLLVSSSIPITPATAVGSTPSRVTSPVSTATTGIVKSSTVTVPSSVVHINARDLLPLLSTGRSTGSSTPTTAAITASPASISGTVCTSRVSPQQFTRITDILNSQQSDSIPKPMVVSSMIPLTSHTQPVTTNPSSSQPRRLLPNVPRRNIPISMNFNFRTLRAPLPSVQPPSVSLPTSGLPRVASAQVLNTLANQILPPNPTMEQLQQFLQLARLPRNHVSGLQASLTGQRPQGVATVRAVQIPRDTLGHGIGLTTQAPSIAAAITGAPSRPLGPPVPPPTSTSQLTASPCQWTPENVSITGVTTVNTEARSQAGHTPSPHLPVGTDTNLLNPQPRPVPRLSTGVPLTSGLPTPRLQVVSTSQGIMIKWTFGEEHVHKQCYVDHYDLYAHAHSKTNPLPPVPQWGKVGSISPLPLPMAVTLTNFARGQCYFFAVRALFTGGGKSDYSEPKSVVL